MLKKCKIVILPTNQQTKYLMVYSDVEKTKGKLILNGLKNDEYKEYQHLYIISDDEIKENNTHFYNPHSGQLHISGNHTDYIAINKNGCKKVIATTDTSLYIHQKETISIPERVFYLPQPSQQFIQKYIEEYNKGNIIEDVLVEYEIKSNAGLGHNEWVHLQHIEGKRYLPVKIKANTHQDTYELGKEDILEDFEIEINLKINPKDNTITIKKAKDSWNREEVENLIYSAMKDRCYTTIAEWKKWIKENL